MQCPAMSRSACCSSQLRVLPHSSIVRLSCMGLHPLAQRHAARVHSSNSRSNQQHHRPARLHRCKAAEAVDSAAFESIYYSPAGRAKLLSRHLAANPAETVLQQLQQYSRTAHLWTAATVDKHVALPAALSVAAAATAAVGLGLPALLESGLPLWARQLLFSSCGMIYFRLPSLLAVVASLPLAAWALRQWGAAAAQLLNAPGALGPALLQLLPLQPQHRDAVAQLLQHFGSTLTVAVLLAHTSLLLAAGQFMEVVGLGVGGPGHVAAAIACWAAAALPAVAVAVASLKSSSASSSCGSGAATPPQPAGQPPVNNTLAAVAALLGLEAAWVATGAAPLPAIAAAAVTAAGAACLYALQALVVTPWVTQYRALAGDTVEVLVSAYVDGIGAPFDVMDARHPLQLPVGLATEELGPQSDGGSPVKGAVQAAAGSSGAPGGTTAASSSGGSADAGASSSSSSGVEVGVLDARPLELLKEDGALLADPQAQWIALWPWLSDALPGRCLGEEFEVVLDNGDSGPYHNPALCWWQPMADYLEKFSKVQPEPGEVFAYEVRQGCWLRTQITAAGARFVQLDANYGLRGERLRFKVRVVKLMKQQQEEQR